MNVNIRFATSDDINILAALGTTTCYEAYFELDPSRDLADYCARVFEPENVRAEFEDVNATFLIAESDERAIGFAKIRENKHIECLAGRNATEIERLYVLERMKSLGIGRLLVDRCREIGRERGYDTLWLGVWNLNIAAQKFYEKLGMTNIGTTGFSDGKNDFVNFVYAIDI